MDTMSQKFNPSILEDLYELPITRLHWGHVIPLHPLAVSMEIASLMLNGGYYVSEIYPTQSKECMDGSSRPRNVAYKLEEMYGILGWSPDIQRIFQRILPWMKSLLYVTWYKITNQNAAFPFLCPYMVLADPLSQNPYFTSTNYAVCTEICFF